MEYEVKELDIKDLQEEILRKCKKKAESLPSHDVMKNNEYQKDLQEKDTFSIKMLNEKTDEIAEEEPFEDILAEKRRKYTAKEEFIYLLYSNILPAFVIEWDGYFLRKKRFIKKLSEDDKIDEENIIENRDKNDDLSIKEKKKKDKTFVPSWKLSLPDEFVNIKFNNKNSYYGYISRKMMEGEGTYRWHDGTKYQGQFENNKIQGRGRLEWNNNCWYEGDFADGLRHGKGMLVDRENSRMYIGQWHMGHKHEEM